MKHAPDSSYSWFRMAVSLALATIGGIGLWSAVITLPVIQKEFGIDRAGASVPSRVHAAPGASLTPGPCPDFDPEPAGGRTPERGRSGRTG